jgi:UDP-3-O-[3-hydroxymyristoyl] glucosamine N-acyltransferase
VGHITIGSHVTIAAQSGVVANIPDGQVVLGAPAIEADQGKEAYGMIRQLPEIQRSIQDLQRQFGRIAFSAESDSERSAGQNGES